MDQSNASTAATSTELVIMMPRHLLRESPFNPRQHYNEASLNELAQTMKPPTGRVHSPLVVRPLEQTDIEQTHEIVFGHRRFRAAGIAGQDDVPVIVRDLTDEEARVAQLIENAQRDDVSVLEEADSLNELRHQYSVSIEELMKRTGKGRRYVYTSLALARSHAEVREALTTGVIGAEVARYLAAVPNPLQPRALKESTYQDWDATIARNVRRAHPARKVKAILEERFRLKLADAQFDTLSFRLVPDTPACDACPKRSDAEPTLLEECGADVCTDPDCFAAKSMAHTALMLDEARKKGKAAIDAEAARDLLIDNRDNAPTGYVVLTAPSHRKSLMGMDLTIGDLVENAGASGPKPTVIAHPHRPGVVLECITEEQADALIKAKGSATEHAGGADDEDSRPGAMASLSYEERRAAALAGLSPEERAVQVNWLQIKQQILRRVMATPRTASELLMMAMNELECCGDFGDAEKILGWAVPKGHEDGRAWRLDVIRGLDADQLAQLMVMVAIDRGDFMEPDVSTARLRLAQTYGVDVMAPEPEEEAAEPVATPEPEPAAPAPKVAGAVKYRNQLTGESWSGRGLQPKWLKVAISEGKTLSDFEVQAPEVKKGKTLRQILADRADLDKQLGLLDGAAQTEEAAA